MATTTKNTAAKKSAKTTKNLSDELIADVKEVQAEVTEQATSALNVLSENIETAQGIAKQVWFAGLGVVGRSVEEVQTRVEKTGDELRSRYTQINKESQKLVTDLVNRGEKVQSDAEGLLKESRTNIEEQIEIAKGRLGGLVSVVDIPARLQDISNRLESLSKDMKKSA